MNIRSFAPTFILACAAPQLALAQCSGPFTDGFADGVIAPEWQSAGSCGQLMETGGALVFRDPTGCSGSRLAELDPTFRTLCGDFDVEVDFDLVTFTVPPRGMIRVFGCDLHTVSPRQHVATIERFHETPGNSCVIAPMAYKAWVNGISMNCASSMIATTATTGTFTMRRRGSQVTLGFIQNGVATIARTELLTDAPLSLRMRATATHPAPHEVRVDEVRLDPIASRCTNRLAALDDGFDDGVLDPRFAPITGCGTPAESGGKLVLVKPGGCTGNVGINLAPVLCGDFDAHVDFDLRQFPAPPSGQWSFAKLEARFIGAGSAIAIERFAESPGHPCIPAPQHFKSFVLGRAEPCDATMIVSNATRGALRVERVGSTLTTYYDSGSGSKPDGPWLTM